jgi:DNA polymerase III subunit beta
MVELNVETGTGLRLTCERDELVRQVLVVARALSVRSTVQILSGILLDAVGDRLSLAATDMELSLQAGLDASVDEPGRVVIPGRLLVELARLLPDSEVSIAHRLEDGVVEVNCGSANYKLHTYGTEDFPRLPDPGAASLYTIDRPALVETAVKVSRSASRDESRPVLTGILVRFEPGKVVMAATDSYRLSVKETKLEQALDGELEANVPARTLQELGRIASAGGAATIGVTALENQVVFTVDDVMLSSRLVEGRFPNYQQLLPESYEHELRVSRDELLEVVRRVGLLAQKNAPLRLRFSEGALDVSAQTPDVGEASESLPVPFNGEPLEIGFNPEFFRDGLESAESEELVLKLISPLRPGLIQSGGGEDGGAGFIYLVMPIRLNV